MMIFFLNIWFCGLCVHYSNAFSKNGLPTIVANDDPNRQLGAASSMSDSDYIRVNLLYQCTV